MGTLDSINTIALVGPTAVGKTELALGLAEKIESEIVSVDSMQVYRFMDIGTAKPSREEQQRVPHHLIDIVNPDETYHAGRFVTDATEAIGAIAARGRAPLLVGGTGLYLKSLLEGIFELPEIDAELRKEIEQRFKQYDSETLHRQLLLVDPEMAARIHPRDRQRIKRGLEIFEATGRPWSEHLRQNQKQNPHNCLVIGLTLERSILYERINRRSGLMLETGLVEEVQNLLHMGYSAELKSMQSIGYRHTIEMLTGKRDLHETVLLLARDTRRYAKRQYTWFNRVPGIEWYDANDHKRIADRIAAYLAY